MAAATTTAGLGIGKYICSTRFTIGGHDWRIRYYPDGATEEFKGYVAVHLELMSELTNVRLLYDFKLRNNQQQQAISSTILLAAGGGVHVHLLLQAVLTSEGPSTTCGTHKFIHKNELANSTSSYLWAEPNRFTHGKKNPGCEVTVIKDSRKREIAVRSCTWNVQVPPSNLSLHLLPWFSSGQEADVTFKVEQLVLAMRSPIFKQQLFGQGQGQGQTPRDRHEGEDMAKRLFAAAETYAMGRLKLLSYKTAMASRVNEEEQLAYDYNEGKL
ncbi:hypothetical protein HU200_039822 [Digitaria exilis]|uniref:MATH domain-containing protein n=1 Tax=Digitaria exilis TaxID=1010633 RepID=A0A835EJA6_9POAL|nr:hypothetical protein HU200_039822 [Digitaria exilis]